MAKTPINQNKSWTSSEESQLRKLAKGNTPTGLIAHDLGRSTDSVRSKASDMGVSLKPTNQSPYNRRK
jgi:hypothetical protein